MTNDGLELSGRWKTAARSVAHPVRAAGRNGATSTRPACHQRHAPQHLAFHVVTLPVEINASTRAYGLLTRYGILSRIEAGGTKRVLTAAAFTYIAGALTALLTLLYLLFLSQSNE